MFLRRIVSRKRRAGDRGAAYIVALVLLSLFTAMSVSFCSLSDMNSQSGNNSRRAQDTRLAAESGLSFMTYQLEHCGVSGSLRGQALLSSLATKLGGVLNGTANLGGAQVTYDNTAVSVPSIALDGGRSFTARITLTAQDTLHLTVSGKTIAGTGPAAMTVSRQVSMDFHPQWDMALGFGMCSKGPIAMGMNNHFLGLNQPADGSIYSGAPGLAVECGSGRISGDVSVSDPTATLSLTGVEVDGAIRYNAPPVTMPAIDRTRYKSLATTVMNSAFPAAGSYKNIRIPANTNPTFNSAVTIQGILYIEAPNTIYFNNNVTFTGVMVAADPPSGSPDTANYIYFKNNMAFGGVDLLPDNDAAFTAVKQLKGASVLAPGFTMEFKNNMSSVGGMMALKALTVKNNETSTVYGSLLIYGDAGVDFKNNDDLSISLSYSTPPPGFKGYGVAPLLPDPATYAEK
jgi:hypothetical protein